MSFKIARSNPKILLSHKNFYNPENFKMAIAVSKKVSKKAVERNKIRRILHQHLLKQLREDDNHKPYWLLVNLKFGDFCNDKSKLLEEFQNLMFKSHLIK